MQQQTPPGQMGPAYKRRTPAGVRLSLSKKCVSAFDAAKASQSFAARGRRNQVRSEKSEDMCLGFFSAQTLECANEVSARESLYPHSKMPAFLRSVSNFFDTLRRTPAGVRLL